jgi:hypothetical protein
VIFNGCCLMRKYAYIVCIQKADTPLSVALEKAKEGSSMVICLEFASGIFEES